MAITSSDVRYKVTFNLNTSPLYLEFEDLKQGYTALSSVEGLVKITDPTSTVIYKNSGYDTDTFTSPDIEGSTNDWTLTNIQLPLNNDNLPVTGTYIFDYKVTDNAGSTVYTIQKTYDYDISDISPSITSSADCDNSQLTFTDTTVYKITDASGSEISPNTSTKSWKVSTNATNYSSTAISIGSLDTFTIGVNTGYNSGSILYSGVYTAIMVNTLSYVLDAWNGTNWFFVNDQISGSKNSDVFCDSCTCSYLKYMEAISDKRDEALVDYDNNKLDELKSKMLYLSFYYQMYMANRRCSGENKTKWCNKIQNIVQSETDCCDTSTDTVNEPIIPTNITSYIAAQGMLGSTITVGVGSSGLPTTTYAINGQLHIFTSTSGSYTAWDIYYFDGSSWIKQGNIKGASATAQLPLLENDISDSVDAANTTEQILKTYSTTAGELAPNKSYYEITSYVDVVAAVLTTLRIKIDGNIVLTKTVNPSTNTSYELKCFAHRISSTSITSEPFIKTLGVPDSHESLTWITITPSDIDALSVDITVSSDKGSAGGGSDVIVKNLRVQRNIKN